MNGLDSCWSLTKPSFRCIEELDLPDVDLRFLNGHREDPHDSDHTNGLLERSEEFDPFAVQKSEGRANRGDADNSVFRQRPAVLGDRQFPYAQQETLLGSPPAAAVNSSTQAARAQHSREGQSQVPVEHPSAAENSRIRVRPPVIG